MGAGPEVMNYLEFIARVTSHIPDKGQVAAIDFAVRPKTIFWECLSVAEAYRHPPIPGIK
jgi:hypothetical protein